MTTFVCTDNTATVYYCWKSDNTRRTTLLSLSILYLDFRLTRYHIQTKFVNIQNYIEINEKRRKTVIDDHRWLIKDTCHFHFHLISHHLLWYLACPLGGKNTRLCTCKCIWENIMRTYVVWKHLLFLAFNQYLIQNLIFRKVFSAQNADNALKEDINNLPKWVLLTWCVFRNRHELMNL